MATQSSSADDTDSPPPALWQLFLHGWEARRKVDACELTYGSPEHTKCVPDGVATLERATEMASQMSLFSDNEDLEEVATTSLKYLLLPAVLGELTLQLTGSERMDIIRKAKVYFVDYLQRCRSYGITKEDPPSLALPPPPGPLSADPLGPQTGGGPQRKSYNQLAAERAEKILRLKEKRELERRTAELVAALDEGKDFREDGEMGEEEEGREGWVAMLQLHVYKTQELVKLINDEALILQHMETMEKGEGPVAKKPDGASGRGPPAQASPRQPMKPLVITREMIRGQVFGAGYPSVPTMTVEEFYQQRYREEGGGEETMVQGGGGEGEGAGEEGEEESEDAVKKAREWDDFKDENRRGWGNKRNMG